MITSKKAIPIIIIICCLYNATFAQKKTSFKMPDFSYALRAGLLNGQADKAGAEVQLVSGISCKTWFTGIGAGVDYYSGFKSIPLFLDIRKELREKKNTPFVNADVGYNVPMRDKDHKNTEWVHYKFEGGLYYELGAGYKFVLTKALGLSFSAGYSYKNFKEKDIAQYGVGPADEPLPSSINTYDYKFRRISIKVGFWF